MKLLKHMKADILNPAISLFKRGLVYIEDLIKKIPGSYAAFFKRSSQKNNIPDNAPAECLQTIINGLGDEVLIIGPDRRVKQVNSVVLKRFGNATADVLGQPCYKISHGSDEPCCMPWCECPLNKVIETGETICTVHTVSGDNKDKEDDDRWVEVVASPMKDGQGKITEVIELYRDVSESQKLRRELIRTNRELIAINSIARALSQTLDLRATLQIAADTMLDALEAQISWVQLAAEHGKTPAVHANRGLATETLNELIKAVDNMALGERETLATYSIIAGKDHEGTEQLWQFVVTPLISKGTILGTAGVGTIKRPIDQQRIQLLDAIGQQISTAVDRCKLYGEARAARDLRGKLLHKVIAAQEEERKRIARELHDETGQTLTALRLCLERLNMATTSSSPRVKSQLVQSLNLCQQADEEIDKLIFDLRPSLLDDLGLVEAIEYFIQTRLTAAGIEGNLIVTGKEKRLRSELEVSLFRVIQESINNIIKHARAKNVRIDLIYRPNQLEAHIEDDGCGFEVRRVINQPHSGSGLGLLGMKERMGLIGGNLSVTSRPGTGTRIKAIIPLTSKEVNV